MGGGGFEFEFQFAGEESVAAADLFDGEGGGVADFVEGAGYEAFAAGGVEGGCGDGVDAAAADEVFVDGLAVDDGGVFADGSGESEG